VRWGADDHAVRDAVGVIPVWGITWSDLGSPDRVLRLRRQVAPQVLELARA